MKPPLQIVQNVRVQESEHQINKMKNEITLCQMEGGRALGKDKKKNSINVSPWCITPPPSSCHLLVAWCPWIV